VHADRVRLDFLYGSTKKAAREWVNIAARSRRVPQLTRKGVAEVTDFAAFGPQLFDPR
jgi:hypothetical protein